MFVPPCSSHSRTGLHRIAPRASNQTRSDRLAKRPPRAPGQGGRLPLPPAIDVLKLWAAQRALWPAIVTCAYPHGYPQFLWTTSPAPENRNPLLGSHGHPGLRSRGKCPRLVTLAPSSIRSDGIDAAGRQSHPGPDAQPLPTSAPVWIDCSTPRKPSPLDESRLSLTHSRFTPSGLDDPPSTLPCESPRRVLGTVRAGRPAIGLRRSGHHPPPPNTHDRCTSHNAAERNPGCHASPLGDCHPRSHGFMESAGNPGCVAPARMPGPLPPPSFCPVGRFIQGFTFWLARHLPSVSAIPLAQSQHTEVFIS
jgi:hypothetical protein